MNVTLAIQIVQALMTLMIQMPQVITAATQIVDEIEKWHDGINETNTDLIAEIQAARKAVKGG